MIYTEEASFPYPIISSSSSDYKDNTFIFDVKITGDCENYKITPNIAIGSDFLNKLIENNKVEYLIVIKTQDSKFYRLNTNNSIFINRNKLSFKSGSKIQVILRTTEEINLKENPDLDSFYTEEGDDIFIKKNSIIGFSNVVIYEKSDKTSVDLFERLVNKNISSEIKIEIREENIAIVFKDEKYQYNSSSQSKRLNYPYIYMGLQRVLIEMIITESKNEDHIFEIDENTLVNIGKPVYGKIVRLLQDMDIKQISLEDIDEIIAKISPNIVSEYYKGVMGVSAGEV